MAADDPDVCDVIRDAPCSVVGYALDSARPEGWEARFPEEPAAPQIGNRSGMARLFLFRQPRATGSGDGEAIHLSIRDRMAALPGYRPVGRIGGGSADGKLGL